MSHRFASSHSECFWEYLWAQLKFLIVSNKGRQQEIFPEFQSDDVIKNSEYHFENNFTLIV